MIQSNITSNGCFPSYRAVLSEDEEMRDEREATDESKHPSSCKNAERSIWSFMVNRG
jgi:hypothetical protein